MPAADIKVTPQNLLLWSNMEDWDAGASAAPTEHVLSGASATVARESTIIKQGVYSAAVTRAGADATLYYNLPEYTEYYNKKMTFGCWVYATVASRGRIGISDGVASTATSSYHTGVAGWEYLEVSLDVDSAATRIRVEMQVNSGNTTVYFDGGVLVDGDSSGLVLSTANGYAINKFVPSNRFKGQDFTVARRPGSIVPNMYLDSKTIKISGTIAESTAVLARTKADNLDKIINSQRFLYNTDKQKIDLYLFEDRFARGHVQSSKPEMLAALRFIDFEYDFVIPEGFFQYVQMTRSKQTISATPTSFNLTVNGNTFSRPIITITNSSSNITSLTFENLTTSQSFSYVGTLATGNSLVVDTNDLTVENNASDDITNFTGDFQTILVPGVNKIKITGLVSGTLKVDWFDRWH